MRVERLLPGTQVSQWVGYSKVIDVPGRYGYGLSIPFDDVTNKGIVWQYGTSFDTVSFTNPHNNGSLTTSWIGNGTGTPANTVDRGNANIHTSSTPNAWWKVDLDPGVLGRSFQATHMRCQNRSTYSDQTPNNGIVQGSNNDSDWTTVCTFTPGTFNAPASSWTTLNLDGDLGAFRYFRLQLTSTNTSGEWYLCIQEYELFGTLFGAPPTVPATDVSMFAETEPAYTSPTGANALGTVFAVVADCQMTHVRLIPKGTGSYNCRLYDHTAGTTVSSFTTGTGLTADAWNEVELAAPLDLTAGHSYILAIDIGTPFAQIAWPSMPIADPNGLVVATLGVYSGAGGKPQTSLGNAYMIDGVFSEGA